MASKRKGSRNRVLGDRLWDDSGAEWNRTEDDLSRKRIAELLRRADVRIGVHQSMKLRWVGDDEKLSVWRADIEPSFSDYRPPAGAFGPEAVRGHLVAFG